MGFKPGLKPIKYLASVAVLILVCRSMPGRRLLLAAGSDSDAGKTTEQVFKNIQVLKGIPASQLMPTMVFMVESLGVNCDHCHVTVKDGPWPLEKDDKETKRTARRMILMMRAINQQNFGGEQRVTCVTCHNGHPSPARVSAVGPQPAQPDETEPGEAEGKRTAALPALDQVLEKYVQALGGQQAIEAIHSRILKGTRDNDGEISAVEVDTQAPDKFLLITGSGKDIFVRAFDGKSGWNRGFQGVFSLSGEELDEAQRAAQLQPALRLKEAYPNCKVAGRARVAQRDTYVVTAPGSATDEKFYFDAESGLLVRRLVLISSALGQYPYQYDYEDYRETDRVKLPFRLRVSVPGGGVVYAYKTVEDNAPLDDARFQRPAG